MCKCIRFATVDEHAYKSAVSPESSDASPNELITDFQGTIRPPRSILPQKPDYEF